MKRKSDCASFQIILRSWLLGFGLTSFAGLTGAENDNCQTIPLLPDTPDAPIKVRQTDALCAIDFSSDNTAICPKTWSTSAAALVYDLAGTAWQNRRAEFERQVCPKGTQARSEASRELAVFKHSMNFRDTSGTYAPSILLYDHLSRWLGSTVQIPASAQLQFGRDWYSGRVVEPGLMLASKHPSRKMLLAAWQHLDETLAQEKPHSEFLHPETGEVWGAALLFTGRRYGPEVNGTRESGWGNGQNYDFQHTAPFIALRSPLDLSAAVTAGIEEARTDPAMADALAADTSPAQVAWWMLEVLDIVVLDYILGQQDRIGNIDYQWRWLWQEGDELKSVEAVDETPPEPRAVRLRTTWLNDNDAGVRVGYANYARSTDMLKHLRHFSPSLYVKLKGLAKDIAEQGPVYRAIANNYQLTKRDTAAIVGRIAEVDQIITADCKAGNYRFDLTRQNILQGSASVVKVACD